MPDRQRSSAAPPQLPASACACCSSAETSRLMPALLRAPGDSRGDHFYRRQPILNLPLDQMVTYHYEGQR